MNLNPKVLLLVSLAATACTGDVMDAPGDLPFIPGGPEGPVSCEDGAFPANSPLSRLAMDEYERTLRVLVGDALVDGASDELAALPFDVAEEGESYARTDHRTSAGHINGYYAVADALASELAQNEAARVAVVGECARSAPDATCYESFALSFVRRALRRPPSDEERTRALALFGEFPGNDALHALVFTSLMAPDFIYRFENRGRAEGGSIELSGYELATRLSYHFWGAPPDDALLDAAERGDLGRDAGYREQVERLFADERTDETIRRFFAEWLHLERGDFGDSPRLAVLSEGIDTADLGVEMREEVEELLQYHLGRGDGWDDVLLSDRSFARSERLASIYNVEPWDGVGEPPALPAGERSGLLTRGGMLQTSDGSTNPFRRGAFLRRAILCDTVLPPPNDLPPDALQPPALQAGASTREAFASKIVDEPCATCHSSFTPLGYVLEAYDGLGRFRTEERVVSELGEDLGLVTVDASDDPAVDRAGQGEVASPVELSERIAASPKANLCFATQYFRYTFRRHDAPVDQCAIDELAELLAGGASMHDALVEIAMSPAFRFRALEESP